MPKSALARFHGYYDADILARLVPSAGPETTTTKLRKHFTTQDFRPSFRFSPHFHPYATELIRRLVERSIGGLQAADTDYEANADGTLAALPDSTAAVLAVDVKVTPADGVERQILAGTRLALLDGTQVGLDGGGQATLPGTLELTAAGGVRVTDGAAVRTVAPNTPITLVNSTPVRLPDGTAVTLPAGTPLTFAGCRPKPVLYAGILPGTLYDPSDLVAAPYPVKDLDFTSSGAYSAYNWELFYHAPMAIAIQLSKNQRFEEAQRWFHYVFDPTDDSDGPTPERFWKVKPFQNTDVKLIEEILVNLSDGADPVLRTDTVNSIGAWKDAPFRPHVIARYRQTAYMLKAVMAYLDNLIAWGDSLFRQDTGESINEAMQLYVLAANILGPRPQSVPEKGSTRARTYHDLRGKLDEFGNILADLEPDVPFDVTPHPNHAGDVARATTLRSLSRTLYFCVPRNDQLIRYWDTVADRLFKIRNSLNIQGIFRQLPLFEPPIDPALLARAAAAGLDIGAVLSGLNQPLPLVRFQTLLSKAIDLCQEVKSLGNNLLAAMEKEDNEALGILRARHERAILAAVESVKYAQWREAIKATEGLEKARLNAVERYTYYERLLGKQEGDINSLELEALGADLAAMTFKPEEPSMGVRKIDVDIAQDLSEGGGRQLSTHEVEELKKLREAREQHDRAADLDKVAGALSFVPNFGAKFQPFGAGGSITFGGSNLAGHVSFAASFFRTDADKLTYDASKAAKIGGYARREQDWAFQSNLAAGEITQLLKQLRAAQIREAIAERDWKNHQQQIRHAEEVEYFLTGELMDGKPEGGWQKKKTNQAFYAWLKREVKGLYAQCFQFAFDVAKKAEAALRHELGNPELSFVQFGHLAGKEGLLAGERLYLDLKRMDMAFHELNEREYELTKHVSVLQVNPHALLQLRVIGRCAVSLPEEIFDLDCPGHYFRRIKSVAVSIPCVTGPYTSVNCTLTLLRSSIRKSPLVGEEGYARSGADDVRFSDHLGSLQSIVTSAGQNDGGLFETNLRDDRFLPFELSGAVSEWQLELPAEVRQFDYETIADVILHIRYTAREGGTLLRNGAIANLTERIANAQAGGSVRLFSMRHEFPSEWAAFRGATIGAGANLAPLTIRLRREHYPLWSRGRLEAVKLIELFARTNKATVEVHDKPDGTGVADRLVKDASLGNVRVGRLTNIAPPDPTGTLTLYFDDNTMEDLWLTLSWGGRD